MSTATGNTVPTVEAGASYTIPLGTPSKPEDESFPVVSPTPPRTAIPSAVAVMLVAHVATCRVHAAGLTPVPNEPWMTQVPGTSQ